MHFVETKNHGLIQVEVSPVEACSPIKFCLPVNYKLPRESLDIINAPDDSDLIYTCSKLSYDETPADKKNCKK